MSSLVIASCNQNKIAEIRAILGGIYDRILSMTEAGFSGEIEETGATFRDNAILKARAVMEATGMDSLADDSGLEVFALGGAPGVLSARYSSRHGDDAANNAKLLRDMEHLSGKQRDAQFACCIALARPGRPILTAEGTCPGTILREPRGTWGFGYDPLFYMPALGCTMAQLIPEVKNAVSHRYNALRALLRLLEREKDSSCSLFP